MPSRKAPLALRIEPDLLARVDAEAERLGQTRTKFVERALERALGEGPAVSRGPMASRSEVPPASPRASAGPRVMADYELPKIAPRKPR